MTFEEFDNYKFSVLTQAEKDGERYSVLAINFPERLIGLLKRVRKDSEETNPEFIEWVRCENVKVFDEVKVISNTVEEIKTPDNISYDWGK